MLLYEESMIITIMTMTKEYVILLAWGGHMSKHTLHSFSYYFGTYPNNAFSSFVEFDDEDQGCPASKKKKRRESSS